MSLNNYDKQLLALQAAASINADGTTPIAYGCSITRTATGIYKLILPTGEAVTNAQSFTNAQPKGTAAADAVVNDADDFTKEVRVYDSSGTLLDCAIEVQLRRATINPF